MFKTCIFVVKQNASYFKYTKFSLRLFIRIEYI